MTDYEKGYYNGMAHSESVVRTLPYAARKRISWKLWVLGFLMIFFNPRKILTVAEDEFRQQAIAELMQQREQLGA